MNFSYKADYPGPFDEQGIPMLDYRGSIGVQYNPIAIAQYGLGHYNRYRKTGNENSKRIVLNIASWLVNHLELNPDGISVWNHHFDWEYHGIHKAPWYSALAQGTGLSLLVRAYLATDDSQYLQAATDAFQSFLMEMEEGGVRHTDVEGYVWLEESIHQPPTHILNGFIWALWGVRDYYLLTGAEEAEQLFHDGLRTLEAKLSTFDSGYWSLYEHAGTRLPMLTSPFYHRLHIVQLRILHNMARRSVFADTADRWQAYTTKRWNRSLSLLLKVLFKLLYY